MNAQMLSDRELLNLYLQGNKSAISTLIDRHNRRVRDYLRMMVGDADVADDIAQETFIKAVRVIDEGRYTDSGRFLSWVMRIAHNKALDYFRAQKSNNSVSESSAGYNVLGTMRYADKSVEDSMISEQISADVRALVELLKGFSVEISGKRPVAEAIITSGGVKVSEIDPKTMESKKVPGLYFAGEIIDCDAYTGGFNLQIAWATAYAAGSAVET
jgi:RNA polymerase sigma-70 factor (ECF subfamily)